MRTIAEKVAGLGRCEAIPQRFAVLTAAAEGRVIHLLKQPGDPVEPGCAVVELDSTIAEKNLKEKEAACDSQKATFELLQSLPRAEEQNSAKLAIEQAQVAVEKAQLQRGPLAAPAARVVKSPRPPCTRPSRPCGRPRCNRRRPSRSTKC